ncbi:hypothetical protein ABIA39_005955 [Nocardia sp. GAS34]
MTWPLGDVRGLEPVTSGSSGRHCDTGTLLSCEYGWPFVFFRDPACHRGCVLYHRYDGHYGLLTPSA